MQNNLNTKKISENPKQENSASSLDEKTGDFEVESNQNSVNDKNSN